MRYVLGSLALNITDWFGDLAVQSFKTINFFPHSIHVWWSPSQCLELVACGHFCFNSQFGRCCDCGPKAAGLCSICQRSHS